LSFRTETESPLLEILATITLALVLFLDAMKFQEYELWARWSWDGMQGRDRAYGRHPGRE